MHTVKRIEIIANSFELGKILDALKKADVPGRIVIRNVAGHDLTHRRDPTSRVLAPLVLPELFDLEP